MPESLLIIFVVAVLAWLACSTRTSADEDAFELCWRGAGGGRIWPPNGATAVEIVGSGDDCADKRVDERVHIRGAA